MTSNDVIKFQPIKVEIDPNFMAKIFEPQEKIMRDMLSMTKTFERLEKQMQFNFQPFVSNLSSTYKIIDSFKPNLEYMSSIGSQLQKNIEYMLSTSALKQITITQTAFDKAISQLNSVHLFSSHLDAIQDTFDKIRETNAFTFSRVLENYHYDWEKLFNNFNISPNELSIIPKEEIHEILVNEAEHIEEKGEAAPPINVFSMEHIRGVIIPGFLILITIGASSSFDVYTFMEVMFELGLIEWEKFVKKK